ncbi:roadblock/LC7 domain-containing protein [Actinomadura gamaensis]|uniref:Roadblock/LC7 domain-containing protein n=1 Tax=Actinomadura gamaensis TaxID=1763541 RepID=A0ABV9TZA2_9ACTN
MRRRVTGITGSVLAATDGLVVASDTGAGVDPDDIAAVAAAGLGIARRMAAVTDQGDLDQSVAHCSQGYTAVYAVGDLALMVVLGDEGLDIGRLRGHSRPVLDRIGSILIEGE